MLPADETLIAEACELFCGRRIPALIDRVAAAVRGPYEIPYAFLDAGTPLAAGERPAPEVAPTARHVELAYALLLQRRPESPAIVEEHLRAHASMASLLDVFLLGTEHRARLAPLIAVVTPSVHRVWHVHIPKTAGTSFACAFEDAGWGVVNAIDLADPAYGAADLARVLSLERLRRGALFTGHQSLAKVAPLTLPFDACLAFLRHPLDRAISYFNYMVTRLEEDPERLDADTRGFFDRGFDPTSFERTYADGRILVPNEQCGHLAPERTARAALEHARRARCALYDHRHVDAVLRDLLGVETPGKHNVSRPVLDRKSLPRDLARRILADNAEDLALHEAVASL
jgi:hypothetical protein